MSVIGADMPSIEPWRFQAHLEVWLLAAALVIGYLYLVRVVGPRLVKPDEQVVTPRQWRCFVGAIAMYLAASAWPLHDISEEYLYSGHMLQHMMLSYFMPPLALLATPTWLARLLIGDGRVYRAVHWLTKPIIAGFLFNMAVIVTHIPQVVNASAGNPVLHYGLHLLLVSLSLLMWMVVCGPLPERHIGPGATMIYLFVQSVIPTVPAGWLTFAEKAVYKHYDHPVRVFGLGVIEDQQIAGIIMKLGGSVFLWTIIARHYFRKFAPSTPEQDHSYRRGVTPPAAEIIGHDDVPLTYEEVAEAFARSTPPTVPSSTPGSVGDA